MAGEAELSLEVGVDEGRDRLPLPGLAGHATAPAIARTDQQIR